MKIIAFVLSICFTITLVLAQKTENVVVIVLDGSRYSETFGDTSHQYIPNLWNKLRPQAAIYTRFYNNGTTSTNPGHSTIETGTWQTVLNDGTERPHKPTIFEYFRKEKGSSQTENYVILGKDKLNILSYSDYSGYGSIYGASVKTSTSMYEDIKAFENFKTITTNYHPRLMLMNLPQTDNRGHAGLWNDYLKSIKQADSIINECWNIIQTDIFYKNKTTLIITNDHGRHLDGVSTGFKDHGCGCNGCRHIICMILGPDTPDGIVDDSTRQQIDIAPTIGRLLKFNTTYSTGKIIKSAIDFNVDESFLPNDTKENIIYPNPTHGIVSIPVGFKVFNVFDMKGVVLNHLVKNNVIDLTYQSNGLYFVSYLNGINYNINKIFKY